MNKDWQHSGIDLPEEQMLWVLYTGQPAPAWKGGGKARQELRRWQKQTGQKAAASAETLRCRQGAKQQEAHCPDGLSAHRSACQRQWRGLLCTSCPQVGRTHPGAGLQ
ncbi:MAG: hypothetical protein HQL51_15895 [Magnetococcales bacterium]|nr:hypothetical protein [Magnetococcales bacterium]